MLIVAAVLLGLVVGLALGAVGGGGSVLTVPALVYLLGVEPRQATVASLVVVGTSAAVASVGHLRAGHVRLATGLLLAATGIPASLLGARLGDRLPADTLLIAFAVLMVVAAAAMLLRPPSGRSEDEPVDGGAAGSSSAAVVARTTRSRPRIVASVGVAGLGIGLLTGVLGVGGGFVVVPTLVVLLGLSMTQAVGTSLVVIAANSAVALAGRAGTDIPWHVVVPFTLGAVGASLLGQRLAFRAGSDRLTRAFAVLLLLVAAGVVAEATGLIG